MNSAAFERATFYVMSGTGNTWRVATWCAEVLSQSAVPATLIAVDRAKPEEDLNLGPGQLLGIGMPTHGFTAPWAVIKLAARLPRGKGSRAAVLATRGSMCIRTWVTPGLAGTACFLIAAMLTLKGYRVRGLTAVDMPSNWVQVHPRLSDDTIARVKAYSEARARAFAGALVRGQRFFATWSNAWDLLLGLAMVPISLLYIVFGRVGFAKVFYANDACNACGLCVQNCPVGGVELIGGQKTGRPHWNWHCESCNRCMAYCPHQAIDVSHSWLLIMTAVSLIPVCDWLVDRLLAWSPAAAPLDHAAARFFFMLVWWWVLLIAMGILLHLLARVPALNMALKWTSLSRLFRPYHEPETRVKMMAPRENRRSATKRTGPPTPDG